MTTATKKSSPRKKKSPPVEAPAAEAVVAPAKPVSQRSADATLADAIAQFRERPKLDQLRSPVYQELLDFHEEMTLAASLMTDAKIGVTPPGKNPPQSMTSAGLAPAMHQTLGGPVVALEGWTPWMGTNIPNKGPCSMPMLNGKNPPPGGPWNEVEQRWFRKS